MLEKYRGITDDQVRHSHESYVTLLFIYATVYSPVLTCLLSILDIFPA